jgi:hypothetical protein
LGLSKQQYYELNNCPFALLSPKKQELMINRVKNTNEFLFRQMPNLSELNGKVVWIMHKESDSFILPSSEDDHVRLISFKELWKIQNKIFIDSSIPQEISSSSHENYFSKKGLFKIIIEKGHVYFK